MPRSMNFFGVIWIPARRKLVVLLIAPVPADPELEGLSGVSTPNRPIRAVFGLSW